MAKRQYTGDPIDMTQQHISERDLDEEAEDVEYATDSEPAGQESVDFWPSSATPREELNSDQIAVIEAYADPTREFESQRDISRKVTPEKGESYANGVLRYHLGKNRTRVNASPTQPDKEAAIDDPGLVDKLREGLVAGKTSPKLADRFDLTKDVVLNAAKANYEVYEAMDTELPPVEYTGARDGWEYKDDGPTMIEDDTREGDEERGEQVKRCASNPTAAPHRDRTTTADEPARDGGSGCLALAALAIVMWELARRAVGRLR